jgi:hypothetical protein
VVRVGQIFDKVGRFRATHPLGGDEGRQREAALDGRPRPSRSRTSPAGIGAGGVPGKLARVDLRDALDRVLALRNTLQGIVDKDQEQEVRGIAFPVIDSVLNEASKLVPADDPIVDASRSLITPETIEAGEPIRAVDALVVVDQLYRALKYANRDNEGPFFG